MLSNICRLCSQPALSTAFSMPSMPSNVQRLYRPEELDRDRPVDISVLRCDRCGFVQLSPMLDDEYYDDYLMTATHSSQMQAFQREQAETFIRSFGLVGRPVIEVGSGDGSYLNHLKTAGAVAYGVEPSTRSREIAIQQGYDVESGYVTADRQLVRGPFDAFVTRQVLEHVTDIHGFLTGIRNNLAPGAHGLIEVPSLEKALLDRRFYDFFTDHVNYFSQRTLRMALELNGFEVLETRYGMFDEYNIAVVRRVEHEDFSQLQDTVHELSEDLREFLARERSAGRKVAIWGAGGKGLSLLAAARVTEVDLLVDGDRNKQGFMTPVSRIEVRDPKVIMSGDIDTVVITAMAYRHEIVALLRNEYGFRGPIVVLGHRLETLD